MAGVAITRMEMSASELRAAAKAAQTPAVVRRILALALVLEGEDRETAAQTCGMDRQTLRDWVHRYNSDGVAGLANRKGAGRPPKLNAEQKEAFKQLVEKGPDRAEDRWCAGAASTSSAGSRRSSMSKCMSARSASSSTPWAIVACRCARSIPKSDLKPRRLLKKLRPTCRRKPPRGRQVQTPRNLVSGRSSRRPAGNADARLGQMRGPARARRATSAMNGPISSAPSAPPGSATAALVLPNANAEAMSLHLAEIAKQVAAGAHAILILDGAGYHQSLSPQHSDQHLAC